MKNVVEVLEKQQGIRPFGSATLEEIEIAETELGLAFSKEYKDYLLAYGAASIYGHEFTGICNSTRLNVVDVTKTQRQRQKDNNLPSNLYVIEELHIDDVVIWQDEVGSIYQTVFNKPAEKKYNSLVEYIESED